MMSEKTKIPFSEYFFSVVEDQKIKRVNAYRFGRVWVKNTTDIRYLACYNCSRDTWMVREELLGPRLYRYSQKYDNFVSIKLSKEDKRKLRETVRSFKRKLKLYKNDKAAAIMAEHDSLQWHP